MQYKWASANKWKKSISLFGPFLDNNFIWAFEIFINQRSVLASSLILFIALINYINYHPVHNSSDIHMLTGLFDVSKITEHYSINAEHLEFPDFIRQIQTRNWKNILASSRLVSSRWSIAAKEKKFPLFRTLWKCAKENRVFFLNIQEIFTIASKAYCVFSATFQWFTMFVIYIA